MDKFGPREAMQSMHSTAMPCHCAVSSVCLSVRPSVTFMYSIETSKHVLNSFTFWCFLLG